MSKIVRAANAIISNSDNIQNVVEIEGEYLFMYEKKYTWGIKVQNGNIYLKYYHENPSIDELLNMDTNEFNFYPHFISYSSESLGTKEAQSTFKDLYHVVKEKCFGIDKVLDEIIQDDEDDRPL